MRRFRPVSMEFRWRCFCPAHALAFDVGGKKCGCSETDSIIRRYGHLGDIPDAFHVQLYSSVRVCGHTVGLSLCRDSHLLFIRFLD